MLVAYKSLAHSRICQVGGDRPQNVGIATICIVKSRRVDQSDGMPVENKGLGGHYVASATLETTPHRQL